MPTALIISDFPILGMTAEGVLRSRYSVVVNSWSTFVSNAFEQSDLVVVDVTSYETETALALLTWLLPDAKVVVCSLHRNEVEVYRVERDGFKSEELLPSLFALAA